MSQIIVAFSITIILAFTVICLVMQYVTSVEVSSTLIENFYQFFGGELLVIGGIKVSKNVKEIFVERLAPSEPEQPEEESGESEDLG